MYKFLRWGNLALICLAAMGCAADGSLDLSNLDPAFRDRGSSLSARLEGNSIAGKERISPQGQEPLAGPDQLNGGASTSPHDLILDLPTPQDEEEEIQATPLPPAPTGEVPNSFVYDIPVVRNSAVNRWIEYFTGPGRTRFAYWLRQSGRYITRFRKIFRENGLPEDLAYLPLIESGFTLLARSRAGAVGPWQFMPGTARRSGLKVNRYIDERRHPIKATRAAAGYLSELYAEFSDWHLALAAYNSGENRIRRAIRRTRRRTYWALARTRYIPNETRNYVPKFLAGLIIAKHPEVFGFVGIDFLKPVRFETVSLPRGMSLRYAAKLAGISLREIILLNSEFRSRYTPPGKGHLLRLPPGKSQTFLKKLARAPKEPYPATGRYLIRPGDTFGSIARRFGVSLRSLQDLNAHLNPRRLRIGTKILLPIPRRRRQGQTVAAKTNNRGGKPSFNHTVASGENVWMISRRYGVSAKAILYLNGLSASTTIYPGKRLRIHR